MGVKADMENRTEFITTLRTIFVLKAWSASYGGFRPLLAILRS